MGRDSWPCSKRAGAASGPSTSRRWCAAPLHLVDATRFPPGWGVVNTDPAEHDTALLVLCIDKQLEWDEVARVMLDEGESADHVAVKEAATLREHLEPAKERERKLATAEGLLS